ncbi:Alpha/beta hydrolase family protein [Candidatus Izimaplasma bacterium HR1]|jgi:alpha/beta superfamily hydrolase|uniref:alpha/beta hydrolase n=1 Tax=Candidatus Izimoplasma sp. HR1 TaxID=1541959 RepID=UPI0004F8F82E|nr:Alpha/beta hydrolase family protein [Candidatus Izimaplasma bacterium HR1]
MIKREEIKIELYGKTSEHIFSSNVTAHKLAVLFPGAGSNTRAPFFYYSRYYFLRAGYDVLALSYRNIVDSDDSSDEQIRKLTHSVHKAIKSVKELKKYKEYVFEARSIGNLIADQTRTNYKYEDVISIYASPTSQALKRIEKYPGLVITSTDDETLKEGDLETIKSFSKHEVIVFEGGDHRIECFDTLETIENCKQAIAKTMEYIESKQKK